MLHDAFFCYIIMSPLCLLIFSSSSSSLFNNFSMREYSQLLDNRTNPMQTSYVIMIIIIIIIIIIINRY